MHRKGIAGKKSSPEPSQQKSMVSNLNKINEEIKEIKNFTSQFQKAQTDINAKVDVLLQNQILVDQEKHNQTLLIYELTSEVTSLKAQLTKLQQENDELKNQLLLKEMEKENGENDVCFVESILSSPFEPPTNETLTYQPGNTWTSFYNNCMDKIHPSVSETMEGSKTIQAKRMADKEDNNKALQTPSKKQKHSNEHNTTPENNSFPLDASHGHISNHSPATCWSSFHSSSLRTRYPANYPLLPHSPIPQPDPFHKP